jgi:integral membrane protein (TIGR01906 family)
VSTVDLPAAVRSRPVARSDIAPAWRALVAVGTALSILAVALLLLLQPVYLHAALDSARSAEVLGVTGEQARALSDRTVSELVFGPATFAFAGPDGQPFYDPAEASHLRDARTVLYAFLVLALAGGLVAVSSLVRRRRDPAVWRGVSRGAGGLAVTLTAIGIFFAVAFEAAFELFHRIFFPGGNWAFDQTRERLVQLYPESFWQIVVASLAVLAIGGGIVVWWLARGHAVRLERTVAA